MNPSRSDTSTTSPSTFLLFSDLARTVGPALRHGAGAPDPALILHHLTSLRANAESSNDRGVAWISMKHPADWQLVAVALVVFAETIQHMGLNFGRTLPGRGVPSARLERVLHELGFPDAQVDRRCTIVRRRILTLNRLDHERWVRLGVGFSPVQQGVASDDSESEGSFPLEILRPPNSVESTPVPADGSTAQYAESEEAPPALSTPCETAKHHEKRGDLSSPRMLQTRKEYVELSIGLARGLIESGCPDVPARPLGHPIVPAAPWESAPDPADDPARQRKQRGRMEAALTKLHGWLRQDRSYVMAGLQRRYELTSRHCLALWILLVDRLDCGDEHVGISINEVLGLVGLHQPQRAATFLNLVDRHGPLVEENILRCLDHDCRMVDARVTLSDGFVEKLLGPGFSLRPYIGSSRDVHERHGRPEGGSRRTRQGTEYGVLEEPPKRPLVLPPRELGDLEHAIRQVPLRRRVAEEMGYAELLGYGLGSVFLFEGEPGTGKTLAASFVAQTLKRPMLKVVTSRLLNAYVGATEERIQSVFERASGSNAVLLLDEADSLLGNREQAVRSWEVTQVNTLLHCLENFDGVAILTTNFVGRLDRAIERRLSLRLRFPKPGPAEREQIWRGLIGERFHLEGVSFEQMAHRHELSGSQIKTAVLDLASIAIDREGRRVGFWDVEVAVTRTKHATRGISDASIAGF